VTNILRFARVATDKKAVFVLGLAPVGNGPEVLCPKS
jgi:hypothetical protein